MTRSAGKQSARPARSRSRPTSPPRFFATPVDFRAWLVEHHRDAGELWVGFRKRGTGRPSLTWPESVDEALCFGWIDGVRRRLDEERYAIRFTPRQPTSRWSAVNTRRMAELIAAGRVHPAGLAAFDRRDPQSSGYSYEERQRRAVLGEAYERRFRADARAWTYFQTQPPGYRRMATWWVVSAKREDTRERRLAKLIASSARGERLGAVEPASGAKRGRVGP